ncbi:MAG TPA: hypothetical protein VFI73_10840 [Candidatus Nitrosopolaris sp.]|nr:hypothetical protein [Candidatus Nitrosopolaris sp.]
MSCTWQPRDTPEFPGTTVTWELKMIDVNKPKEDLVHSGFIGKEEKRLSFTQHGKGWAM